MMRSELFIGGAWRAGRGAEFSSIDPATNEIVWIGRAASAADVGAACEAAATAFPAWSRTLREERIAIVQNFARIIERRSAELAELISREMGKTLWDSRGEVQSVIGKIAISIRAQAERAGERSDVAPFGRMTLTHRPLGVVAVFGPFNFPAHLPNGHIVPALLAGNTIVFKPSEIAPSAAVLMVEAWEEAGVPAGVFNLLHGAREAGQALIKRRELAGVLFTGSHGAGAAIHKSFAGRPEVMLALEMGGNNPLIAWPPADPRAAANIIAHSAFSSSGQRCSCARRLILPKDAFGDDVIAALIDVARDLRVGAWNDNPEPFMGPLASLAAADKVEAFEDDLIVRGAREILEPARNGAFVRPGLFDVTGVDTPDEECFGPLLQIKRVATIGDAFAEANATRFGLAGGLISDDAALWERAQEEMRAGILNWNRPTTGASGAMPFGGRGLSGSLRPGAYYAADYVAYPVAAQIAERAEKIAAPGLPE